MITKSLRRVVYAALAASFFCHPVKADDINRLLAEVSAAVKEEISSKQSMFSRDNAKTILLEHMDQVRDNVLADHPNVETAIHALKNRSKSEKVDQLCDQLLIAAKKQHEDREAAFVNEVEAAIKRAGEAVLKAKVESDLAPTISELSRFKPNSISNPFFSPSLGRASQRITTALSFVTQWQDYLTARRLGNDELANSRLRHLASVGLCVPRADILALIKPIESKPPASAPRLDFGGVEEIVARIQKLDEIPEALKKLETIKRVDPGVNNHEAISTLSWLASTYEAFKNGLPMEVSFQSFSNSTRNRFPKLSNELLLLMMPRYLASSERTAKPGETAQGFLERINGEAKSEKNWTLLLRVMELDRLLNGPALPTADTTPLRAFVIAQNQEAAGQYSMAVISYQTALRDTTDTVPIQFVGERLKAIKGNHPKEYAEGVQAAQGLPRSIANSQIPPRGP